MGSSSLTRDQIWALCIGRTESQPQNMRWLDIITGLMDMSLSVGFLELGHNYEFSHEVRRGAQGASRVVPGKSGVYACTRTFCRMKYMLDYTSH